jgi:hypothetical protein
LQRFWWMHFFEKITTNISWIRDFNYNGVNNTNDINSRL